MDIEAFLSGRPVQRRTIAGGSTNGRVRTEYETPNYQDDVVPEKTMRYAKPFVTKLREEVWKVSITKK